MTDEIVKSEMTSGTDEKVEDQSTSEPEPKPEPTDDNVDTTKAQLAHLAALSQRQAEILARQQLELEEFRRKPVEEPKLPDASEFLSDPAKHMAPLVAREIEKHTAPLNEFVVQLQRNNAILELKKQASKIPQYKAILDEAEDEVDAILQNQRNVDASTVHAALVMVAGSRALQGKAVTTSKSESAKGVTSGLPSSPPKAPAQKKAADEYVPTESERAYMRAMGISSVEELLALRNADNDVDSLIATKPKAKDAK